MTHIVTRYLRFYTYNTFSLLRLPADDRPTEAGQVDL